MDPVIVSVFLFVYVGMIVGGLPRLRLDRAAFAVLGAIALIVTQRISLTGAWSAVDWRSLAILVVVTSLFGAGVQLGFVDALARRLTARARTEGGLLGVIVGAAGGVSALGGSPAIPIAFVSPLVAECARRRRDPAPFLVGLACAANVGAAATLLGSAHAIVIWQTLELSFARYLVDGGMAALLGLGAVWIVIWSSCRRRWAGEALAIERTAIDRPITFGTTAGIFQWRLIALFIGLHIVNQAFAQSGFVSGLMMIARNLGADLTRLPALFGVSALLAHLATSLPAVMLLLPAIRDDMAATMTVLTATFASNWSAAGSAATLTTLDQAARMGVRIGPRMFSRIGARVTLLTLALAGAWIRLRLG